MSVQILIGDLAAGKAGEYLVCADLILRGYVAFPSEQGLPYDIVAEIDGRLLRVQVKTTKGPRAIPQRRVHTPAYQFHIGACGKGAKKTYGDSVDLFALVALDTRTIGYFPNGDIKRTMQFRIRANEGTYFEEKMVARAGKVRELRAAGLTYRLIAETLGCHKDIVARICQGRCLERAGGRYLDDCTLEVAIAAVSR